MLNKNIDYQNKFKLTDTEKKSLFSQLEAMLYDKIIII